MQSQETELEVGQLLERATRKLFQFVLFSKADSEELSVRTW